MYTLCTLCTLSVAISTCQSCRFCVISPDMKDDSVEQFVNSAMEENERSRLQEDISVYNWLRISITFALNIPDQMRVQGLPLERLQGMGRVKLMDVLQCCKVLLKQVDL